MVYTHQGPRLYVTADRQTVVEEGDVRAAFLLIAPGGQLSDEDARRYGLTGEAKADAPRPNKARTPRENK